MAPPPGAKWCFSVDQKYTSRKSTGILTNSPFVPKECPCPNKKHRHTIVGAKGTTGPPPHTLQVCHRGMHRGNLKSQGWVMLATTLAVGPTRAGHQNVLSSIMLGGALDKVAAATYVKSELRWGDVFASRWRLLDEIQ